MSLAALIHFYRGKWNGEQIPLNDTDDVLKFMQAAWKNNDITEAAQLVLSNSSFWDQDLTKVEGVLSSVVESMYKLSTQATTKAH
jgi:tagaturonate reductase